MDDNGKVLPYNEYLLEWNDLPNWMRDNEFILTSYRKATYSYTTSVRTISKLHNETINIWTHLAGAVLFILSLHRFLTTVYPTLSTAPGPDIVSVSVYYLGCINCFILSTLFHTLSSHSAPVQALGNSLDHIGVVLVIYGSVLPATHFLFHCPSQLNLRIIYTLLSTTLTVLSIIFTLKPAFRTCAYRRVRFNLYTVLGLSAFLPIIHGTLLYPYVTLQNRMGISNFLGLGILNLTGAAIYAARVPERWFPRTFDIWGSSHQIMHILVVMGALSFERGLLGCVRWWQTTEGKAACASQQLSFSHRNYLY